MNEIKSRVMKIFLTTLIFCCFGVIGYAQSTFPLPKNNVQGHKNHPAGTTNKVSGCTKTPPAPNNSIGLRPDVSVISIIPTLKLWLLNVNLPNPFVKDED